jgi:hypothetical protein
VAPVTQFDQLGDHLFPALGVLGTDNDRAKFDALIADTRLW